MKGFLKGVAADRVSGKKPSPVRAAIAALAAGAAASAVTYRVMRH